MTFGGGAQFHSGTAVVVPRQGPRDSGPHPEPAATWPPGVLRVILAEDDADVAREISRQLAEQDVSVTVCGDGAELLLQVGALSPDVVVMRATLPLITSHDLVRSIRRLRDTPLIVGTDASDVPLAMDALGAGATACVARPYRLTELLPLLGLRAPSQTPMHRATARGCVIDLGTLRLDADSYRVFLRGERVLMPLREFELLRYLMINAGRAVRRGDILSAVWGAGVDSHTNTLSVHVRRLRRRLGDDPDHPRIIETVRGFGYRLTAPAEGHELVPD